MRSVLKRGDGNSSRRACLSGKDVAYTFAVTSTAELDYLDIWLYIAQDSAVNADRFIDLLQSKHAIIVLQPGIGTPRPDFGAEVRSYPVGHYTLFYRLNGDRIELLRVLHGARDLPRVFDVR